MKSNSGSLGSIDPINLNSEIFLLTQRSIDLPLDRDFKETCDSGRGFKTLLLP